VGGTENTETWTMDQTIVHGYTIMVGVTQQCGIDFNGWKT
jgi:hypothetical protein